MKHTITLENVVYAESVVVTTYPQWSDYGCLTNALKVVYKDKDGTYKEETYVTENIDAWVDYYEVNIASQIDAHEYYQQLFEGKYLNHSGLIAKEGMLVRVDRGRKYPKGTEFYVEKAYTYEVPNSYGHINIRYLNGRTTDGEKVHVNAENCVIVGWNGEPF